jgi:hypothetical protein
MLTLAAVLELSAPAVEEAREQRIARRSTRSEGG